MYLYMGQMEYKHLKPYEDWFWPKNRIELIQDWVLKVNTHEKKLRLKSRKEVSYDILIIASGSCPRKGGWLGEEAPNVQGLYGLQDLAKMEENTNGIKRAVIVGGGLIGVEMTEMLHSRKIPVSLLIREKDYWGNVLSPEEAALISQHLRDHGIDLQTETLLESIQLNEEGFAESVKTSKGKNLECQFVGITIGVEPNICFLQNSEIKTNRGVLVDPFFRTNVPDVYAIGDCAEYQEPLTGRKTIEQVWYTGRIHGKTVASTITGTPVPYRPGFWFNSAKFFDIEYQVYGYVPSKLPEDLESLYWQHPKNPQSIRIIWKKDNGVVQGFSLLGIRYRQEVCEQWLRTEATIEEVLPVLENANFDPEFHDCYEKEVVSLYEAQSGKKIVKQKKKPFWKIFG